MYSLKSILHEKKIILCYNLINMFIEAMDADVQKTVIFNITFNNEPNVQV